MPHRPWQLALAVLTLLLSAVAAHAAAEPSAGAPTPTPPRAWVEVQDATGPRAAPVGALAAPRLAIESLVRARPDLVLATPGATPPSSPSTERFRVAVEVLSITESAGVWRAEVRLDVSAAGSPAIVASCYANASGTQGAAAPDAVTAATRQAWAAFLARHLP